MRSISLDYLNPVAKPEAWSNRSWPALHKASASALIQDLHQSAIDVGPPKVGDDVSSTDVDPLMVAKRPQMLSD